MVLPATFVPGFHDEEQVKKMKYNLFGATGLLVSQLSIGAAGFSDFYGDVSIQQCKDAIHEAIKAGINYIDTAPWYGHGVSEEILGKCLEGIPRQAYYIATKVGRYEPDLKLMFDFSAEKTRWSVETSLKRLQLDYVDVIQAHDIEFAKSMDIVLNEMLPVLEEVVKSGKAKFIGVTGYPIAPLAECLNKSKVKIDAVLSYTRLSLLDTTLKKYLPEFQSKNLGIINAAGNCMGLLTNAGPQPWNPATQPIKDMCAKASEYCKANGVELGKLAMHFCHQQVGPHTHLVGMNSIDVIEANLDVLYNGLNDREEQVLKHIQTEYFAKLEKGHWEEVLEQQKQSLP